MKDVKEEIEGEREIIDEGFEENEEMIGNMSNYMKEKEVMK